MDEDNMDARRNKKNQAHIWWKEKKKAISWDMAF